MKASVSGTARSSCVAFLRFLANKVTISPFPYSVHDVPPNHRNRTLYDHSLPKGQTTETVLVGRGTSRYYLPSYAPQWGCLRHAGAFYSPQKSWPGTWQGPQRSSPRRPNQLKGLRAPGHLWTGGLLLMVIHTHTHSWKGSVHPGPSHLVFVSEVTQLLQYLGQSGRAPLVSTEGRML